MACIKPENPGTHTFRYVQHRPLLRSPLCVWGAKSWLTLSDPMDCSPPGSSVQGISQARILEEVAISFSKGSSWPRNQTCVSYVSYIGKVDFFFFFLTTAPSGKPELHDQHPNHCLLWPGFLYSHHLRKTQMFFWVCIFLQKVCSKQCRVKLSTARGGDGGSVIKSGLTLVTT